MEQVESKLQKLCQLRDEQREIKKEFLEEYFRIRNSRRHRNMASNNHLLIERLIDFNNELKKIQQATIARCVELRQQILEHAEAHKKLISNYSLTVGISFWGDYMAEGGIRFFTIISPEIIAEITPFDGFTVANNESEMQRFTSTNLLEIKDECWLYWVLRKVIGLTPQAILSIRGMGSDVIIGYKSDLKYFNNHWIKQ